MVVRVTNAQRRIPLNTAQIARLARCAIRQLGIRAPGTLAITFIDGWRMRSLNRTFLAQDRTTDVLTFRYDGEPILGDILVAPSAARQYARGHGLPYAQELARYVIHGILHWVGDADRTKQQQARMRRREDRLLARCGVLTS